MFGAAWIRTWCNLSTQFIAILHVRGIKHDHNELWGKVALYLNPGSTKNVRYMYVNCSCFEKKTKKNKIRKSIHVRWNFMFYSISNSKKTYIVAQLNHFSKAWNSVENHHLTITMTSKSKGENVFVISQRRKLNICQSIIYKINLLIYILCMYKYYHFTNKVYSLSKKK